MQIKKDIMWRIYGSFVFVCLFGLLILGQIVRIQFIDGPDLLAMRDSLTLRNLPIPASRGNIYSSDGALLATSVLFMISAWIPEQMPLRRKYSKKILIH